MVETDTDQRMELNLDLGVYCLAKPLSEIGSDLLKNKGILPSSESEIHRFIDRLEEERRKIEPFKRELPLCMLFLSEGIEKLKVEATRCAETRDGSETEGSVALDGKFDDGRGAKSENDKKNWMSSAQLWISSPESQLQSKNEEEEEEEEEEDYLVIQKRFPNCNFGNKGGTFLPLMHPYGNYHPLPHRLTLMTQSSDMAANCRAERHQQQKKDQRRRWSPELHRRFIDALQRLGGSQVATPKQIRELMQVEGLTNDEVKSHLQKYRIHVKKRMNFPAAETANTACEGKDSESRSVSESESPQGPLSRRGFSGNGGLSSDAAEGEEEDDEGEGEGEEDEKSDGQSCKKASNLNGEVVHLHI